jgi:hypothetical protein
MIGQDGNLREWYKKKYSIGKYQLFFFILFIGFLSYGVLKTPPGGNANNVYTLVAMISIIPIIGITFLRDKIVQFICPHCLKTILFNDIAQVKCPFCEKTFRKEDSRLPNIIFKKCDSCNSKIKYFSCPKCNQAIDLFAPYNQKELEAKRYD